MVYILQVMYYNTVLSLLFPMYSIFTKVHFFRLCVCCATVNPSFCRHFRNILFPEIKSSLLFLLSATLLNLDKP